MDCEAAKAADREQEGARVVAPVGDLYYTISPEGWAWALKLLAARALDNARKRVRAAVDDR